MLPAPSRVQLAEGHYTCLLSRVTGDGQSPRPAMQAHIRGTPEVMLKIKARQGQQHVQMNTTCHTKKKVMLGPLQCSVSKEDGHVHVQSLPSGGPAAGRPATAARPRVRWPARERRPAGGGCQ